MLQRNIPDGEGLKFGIAGLDAPQVVVIKLGQTGRHLAASGSGCGDDHQRSGGLNIVVAAVAVLADDQRDVGRVALDGVVDVDGDVLLLQLRLELICAVLAGVMGDDHAAYVQASLLELLSQTEDILIVGDAQIAPDLVLLDVRGTDDDDNLRVIGELHQHAKLGIRRKARQDSGGVKIIKQFAAKLQIELVSELTDALLDVLGLHFYVFFIVKTDFHIVTPYCKSWNSWKRFVSFSNTFLFYHSFSVSGI